MTINERWLPLEHPAIVDGYYLSSLGRVKYLDGEPDESFYEASNGYNFYLFKLKKEFVNRSTVQLFPIDDLLAETFIKYKPNLRNIEHIKVIHKDGDTRNNIIDNLDWVEDVEEWRDVEYHDIFTGLYQASNWGNVRNKETGLLVNKFVNSNGSINVNLLLPERNSSGRLFKTHSAHRIIMRAFWCFNEDEVVNHIDGNPQNNYLKNLEFCSQASNTRHAMLTFLKNNIPLEDLKMVRDMLIKYRNTRAVYDMIDHEKYPYLTRNVISFVRNGRYDNRFKWNGVDRINILPCKMTTDEIDMVRDKLFEYDCNCKIAYEHIDHDQYPHISLQMVKEIKTNKYSSYARSNKYDLSKLVFKKTPPPSRFTTEEADIIRDALMACDGSVKLALVKLSGTLDNVTKDIVADIKRGKIYKRSIKYNLDIQNKYPFVEKEEI